MVTVKLRAGPLELDLAPEIGGSIRCFDYVTPDARQHLLRPAAADATDVLGMASFPLVPFANRIRGGSFMCDGVKVTLAPNLAGDPSPLHGQGWLGAWQVVSHDASTATLSFEHPPGEWPWHYKAWQHFALDPNGLTLTLGCRNLSPHMMPCSLAQHPYFPGNADTIIDVDVASAWTVDEHVLPVEEVAPTGRYSLRHRPICGTGLDNSFEGWRGTASFDWPGAPMRLQMTTADASRFQVYSPVDQNYFAAEPVQNTVAALNAPQERWADLGVECLEQHSSREMTVRFDVSPSAG